MSKLEKIVEELSTLTVMEAADLSKMLEEKWGVSAAATVAVAAAAGPAAVVAEASRMIGRWSRCWKMFGTVTSAKRRRGKFTVSSLKAGRQK